jgi:hypothetical protein
VLRLSTENGTQAQPILSRYQELCAWELRLADLLDDEFRGADLPADINQALLSGKPAGGTLLGLYDAANVHDGLSSQLPSVGKRLDEFWAQARVVGLVSMTPSEREALARDKRADEDADALIEGLLRKQLAIDGYVDKRECLVGYVTGGPQPRNYRQDWPDLLRTPPSVVFAGASPECGAVLANRFRDASGGRRPSVRSQLLARFPADSTFVNEVFPP